MIYHSYRYMIRFLLCGGFGFKRVYILGVSKWVGSFLWFIVSSVSFWRCVYYTIVVSDKTTFILLNLNLSRLFPFILLLSLLFQIIIIFQCFFFITTIVIGVHHCKDIHPHKRNIFVLMLTLLLKWIYHNKLSSIAFVAPMSLFDIHWTCWWPTTTKSGRSDSHMATANKIWEERLWGNGE